MVARRTTERVMESKAIEVLASEATLPSSTRSAFPVSGDHHGLGLGKGVDQGRGEQGLQPHLSGAVGEQGDGHDRTGGIGRGSPWAPLATGR